MSSINPDIALQTTLFRPTTVESSSFPNRMCTRLVYALISPLQLSSSSASAFSPPLHLVLSLSSTGLAPSHRFSFVSYQTFSISFHTNLCTLILAGDLNIHVERPSDPHTRSLLATLNTYSLACRVDSPTHDLGGTLDIICSRNDLPHVSVAVSDPGLSDHHLLTWTVPFTLPPLVYKSVSYRPWNRLDINAF